MSDCRPCPNPKFQAGDFVCGNHYCGAGIIRSSEWNMKAQEWQYTLFTYPGVKDIYEGGIPERDLMTVKRVMEKIETFCRMEKGQ